MSDLVERYLLLFLNSVVFTYNLTIIVGNYGFITGHINVISDK